MNIRTEIELERIKQGKKWSAEHDKEHTTNDWITLIVHQLGQIQFKDDRPEEVANNMIAVAALAIACIESLDTN
jgi:hypothetical protein